MNEHAGASCALSVLIVIVFAVLLHDRNPSPHKPATKPESTAKIDAPPPPLPVPKLAEPPAIPVIRPAPMLPTPRPSRIVPPEPPAVTTVIEAEIRPVAIKPVAAALPAPKPQPRASRPRSSFVEVEAGESLADVATRVYGTAETLEAFWKANRDQLAKPDSPLPRGTLLRTP